MFLPVLFTALGLTTQGVFVFLHKWFDRPDRLVPLLIAEGLLFVTALVLEYTNVYAKNELFLLLKFPLLSLLLYKAMQWSFVGLFGYRPQVIYHARHWRRVKDAIFNTLFLVVGSVVLIHLIFGRIL